MEQSADGVERTVWLLTDDRPGNRTQAIGAAMALGWPFEEKRLQFNALQTAATPRLGATLSTLEEASRAVVGAPFPDLVIGAGKRVVPVARWIRRESAGRTRVVLIGRRTPDGVADLTVRPAYLRQVQHPKLLELVLPLTQVDDATLDRAKREQPDPLAGLPDPRVVFLIGGPSGQHEMDVDFATTMAVAVARAAREAGGGIAILTSRRTPAGVADAIRMAVPDARVQEWSAERAIASYLAFLANADLLVVTGESESMLAEGVAAGKPLTIYPLVPKQVSKKVRFRGWIATLAEGEGPLAPFCRAVMSDGWVAPRRDLSVMHRLLEQRGWGRMFDGALNVQPPEPIDERAKLADRIRSAMAGEDPVP